MSHLHKLKTSLDRGEEYANLREERRELNQKLAENLRTQEKLMLDIAALKEKIRAKELAIDELRNNKEEEPYKSEVEGDLIAMAKRQEEFSN